MDDNLPQNADDRRARLKALKDELVGGLLLSSTEVAEILDVHPRTVGEYIRQGRLGALQLAGSWKVPENALRVFVNEARQQLSTVRRDPVSPFSEVRWVDEDAYEARIGETWWRVTAVEGVAIDALVAFSRKAYDHRWQNRIDEDLVEVLNAIGVPTGPTVTVHVRPLDGGPEVSLPDVAMTRENRMAILGDRLPDAARELLARLKAAPTAAPARKPSTRKKRPSR